MTAIIFIITSALLGLVSGYVFGRSVGLDIGAIHALEAQAARRFAGKLGDRIGRQRLIIKELKKQLKTISTSTPAMAKPTNRPNLPH